MMNAANVVKRSDRPGKVRCKRCRADDRLRERHGENYYVPGRYIRVGNGPKRPKPRRMVVQTPDWPRPDRDKSDPAP